MTDKLNIAIAQINTHMGDIEKNLKAHIEAAELARDQQQADIIIFPELSLTGYPPEDLLLRHAFLSEVENALAKLKQTVKDIHIVVGHPQKDGDELLNACSLIYNGEVLGTYAKLHLPNYGVFDECRYFKSRNKACVVDIKGVSVGLIICEDAWDKGPVENAVAAGARIILDPNASPFTADKHEIRCEVIGKRARDNNVGIVYVNHVCGHDDLIFDGGSMVIDNTGTIQHCSGFFNASIQTVAIEVNQQDISVHSSSSTQPPSAIERIYDALVLGVRDYINKNNFPGVLIGLSGGIDSALTCAIAVDALGADRVHGVAMPSRYTSDISNEDAAILANNLNVTISNLAIESAYQSFLDLFKDEFAGKKPDITEENIQARCRCIILMALSNANGKMVLTTSNRSEMAVGYSTLYGDMGGGYAVLKDVPKTLVYELARYRNTKGEVIPERTITRAPSAELAPDQTDQDSLPPYETLDNILELYLNQSASIPDIVAAGHDKDVVTRVVRLIHLSEYKRKQAAIGPRINKTSFIRDWRYPVTNGFKG
jgi:NAD+ synthase (glutamine-hydrolysing)